MICLDIPGIDNGYIVDDIVWRGAQPADSAWPLLAKTECKSVIDLNSSGVAILTQKKLVQENDMIYVSLDWSGILPPSQASIKKALESIDGLYTVTKEPVFVHCEHGSDRTGTLCACWRMHHDGWSFERAMEEAFTSLGTQGMHEFWMAAAVAEYAHSERY